MDIYRYDESHRNRGCCLIAGIDEAGRGPLAGPVVACAVVLQPGKRIKGLRDSKKVPERERERLFWEIITCCIDAGIGMSGPEAIDRVNILAATRLAMEAAVNDLSCKPDLLLIDAVNLASVDTDHISITKGESVSASIAAASIIAKVVRDRIMQEYSYIYPEYGFARHKGYPTKEHVRKLSVHGPCQIHRKTFEKVMSVELPFAWEGLK